MRKAIYSGTICASFFLLIGGWHLGFSGSKQYLDVAYIEFATVETGEFSQKVNGYGVLQSQNQRLISASATAIVDEILVKPGAQVSVDTVILTLKNPQLEIAMQEALDGLHNARSNKRKINLEQQRELLQQESELAQLQSQAEMATLKLEAQSPLVESGIISGMEAKQSFLEAKQLNERVSLEKRRLSTLKQVHQEQLLIQDDAILQAQSKFKVAKKQLEQLIVKAGLDGVLQKLGVTLGQSVTLGSELATVGSLTSLIAEIKVPQLQVNLVSVGSDAEVDTRHGLFTGKIVRIDPVVADGAVSVDIQMPEQLSADIRPMQMVDATIFGSSRSNVSSVIQPSGVTPDSQHQVFKFISDKQAVRVTVQFGQVSNNTIEVKSGLKPGDRIIINQGDINKETQVVELVES